MQKIRMWPGSSSPTDRVTRICRSTTGTIIISVVSAAPACFDKPSGRSPGLAAAPSCGARSTNSKNNIERGDTTIDVIGFSRGAALALDFVNEVAKGKAKLPDGTIPTVRFLGLFDCVPSFGVAISPLNIGWDLDLPANVRRCFHALALDERRGNFHLHRPKVLGEVEAGRLTEVWFRGVHSDIGGNGAKEDPPRGLASIALNWMFVNAQACGLHFDPTLVEQNKAAARAEAKMLDNFDPIETAFRKLREGDLAASYMNTPSQRDRVCEPYTHTIGRLTDLGGHPKPAINGHLKTGHFE